MQVDICSDIRNKEQLYVGERELDGKQKQRSPSWGSTVVKQNSSGLIKDSNVTYTVCLLFFSFKNNLRSSQELPNSSSRKEENNQLLRNDYRATIVTQSF